MNIATVTAASAGLFHPHVPFDEPPDLPFGIAVLQHPSDEIVVFLFGIAAPLCPARNHRHQASSVEFSCRRRRDITEKRASVSSGARAHRAAARSERAHSFSHILY